LFIPQANEASKAANLTPNPSPSTERGNSNLIEIAIVAPFLACGEGLGMGVLNLCKIPT